MQEFESIGFTVRSGVLSASLCQLLYNHWKFSSDYGEIDSSKDAWQNDKLLFDIATDPILVDPVCELLGDKVYVWGTCFRLRKPDQIHNWHCDVETMSSAGFASVWIGLSGTHAESTLNLIPGSHLYGRSIQEELHDSGNLGKAIHADSVGALAKKIDKNAEIEKPNLANGDALIFDGRLWHGSNNRSSGNRLAMLIQYARNDQTVQKKIRGPVSIPPKFETVLPQVFPINCDYNSLANPVASAPANGLYSDNILGAEFYQLDLPLKDDSEKGWKPYIIARGATPNTGSMSVHASTLASGKSPHPPHNHLDEEILLVLEGEAEIVICDDPAGSNKKIHHLRPGDFVLYPPYQHHTIVNNSNCAINYLMFRWSGKPSHSEDPIDRMIHSFSLLETGAKRKNKHFRGQKILDGQTHFLERLECHTTILESGGSYDAHSDKHDVAIVVFEGEVEINGIKAGRGGVFYMAAGVDHDMKNTSGEIARYLVFEFHAHAPEIGRTADAGGQNIGNKSKDKSASSRRGRGLKKLLRRFFPKAR